MHNYREKTAFEDMIKNIQQNKYSKYKYPMGYYKKINEQYEYVNEYFDKGVSIGYVNK